MLKFDELPSTPENDRIMVRPDAPEERTRGGLIIPEIAQKQAMSATLIDAGLRARDILYDNGAQMGDKVLFGQFAGVWEEWDHIVVDGNDPTCEHDWERDPESGGFRREAWKCACAARRLQEPVLVMNVGDILANVSKAERLRSGEMTLHKARSFDGKTTHVYLRRDEVTPTFSDSTAPTNGVNHAA